MIRSKLSKTTPNQTAENVKYKRDTPTLATVGGLPAGTVPDGTVQELLDKILYPYQAPAFTSFSLGAFPTTIELGQAVSGNYQVTWNVSNLANWQTNTFALKNLLSNAFLFQNFGGLGRNTALSVIAPSSLIGTVPFLQIGGINSLGQTFNRSANITYSPRRFAGIISPANLTSFLAYLNAQFGIINVNELTNGRITLSYNDLQYQKNGTTAFNCSASEGGAYIVYAYDTSLGESTFTSGSFPAAFRPVQNITVRNQFGVLRSYYLYISSNAFNSPSIPITVVNA